MNKDDFESSRKLTAGETGPIIVLITSTSH